MILLDTFALIWIMNGDPLSKDALGAVNQARDADELFLSPISAWEIGILAQRQKVTLSISAESYISRAFSRPGVQVAALTPEIAVRASYLPGCSIPIRTPALILTAFLMGFTLVTRDREILRYAAEGHVSALRC